MKKWMALCIAAMLAASVGQAQETRGTIYGSVTDQQGAAVPRAAIKVTNTETNVTVNLESNDIGYYEANLLLPGTYSIQVQAVGFKAAVREGATLQVGGRVHVDVSLAIGTQAETVTVNADAPLLDTMSASSGRVVDNRSLMELPIMGNSATSLVRMAPGVQTGGVNAYIALHSNLGGSDYSINGGVGGNEWSIDGASNNGNRRRTAVMPYTDTLQEFRIETSNFDASAGHSTGVSVQMMSKAGTNDLHGALTWQHWQQRLNATGFFVKQEYHRRIAAAEAAGNAARAAELRNTPMQPTGRSNNWGVSAGGPIVIPKLINGRNKLFFFFSYNGFRDSKSEDGAGILMTVPTLAHRQGNFSDLLNLPNAAQYQLYDPLSVRPDPDKRANFVRTPIAGNILSPSMFQNPAYAAYVKLIPAPNVEIPAGQAPVNNYLASAMPYNWDYKAFSNRIDYQATSKHRVFGRWNYTDFLQDRSDWTYETLRGLHSDGLNRHNIGGIVDWTWTATASTILDVAISANEFRDGNRRPLATSFKPTDLGFPAYLDTFDSRTMMPYLDFSAYRDFGDIDGGNDGYPSVSRYRVVNGKADLFHVRGSHSLRFGVDMRGQHLTGSGSPYTSGRFAFNNTYTRKYDTNIEPAAAVGHDWAAFIMGLPSTAFVDRQDSYAMVTPYYGWYGMDTWRATPKLTLTLGLRMEYELGSTERYNRSIGWFDPTLTLPITAGAQASYAAKPIAQLDPSKFVVRGGSVYPGSEGAGRKLNQNELMFLPRFGFAYQVGKSTVIRGGYGLYFDSWNVQNFNSVDQLGFSRSTSTVFTNDAGVNWLAGNPAAGISPLADPFPLRADGTRYNEPVRNGLASMAKAGGGWDPYTPYDLQRARQQRWRIGVQQQIGSVNLVEVAYSGTYSDRNYANQRLNALPREYFIDGNVRNTSAQTLLDENVPNPFLLSNFASLAQSHPQIYQDMSSKGFFTSPTIRRNALLRQFPQMTGNLTALSNLGKVETHSMEARYERRFSKGLNLNLAYTLMGGQIKDLFLNEFETAPSWRQNNNTRPHRFTATGIYELPFGDGRPLLNSGFLSHILGGFQTGVTYEWQPGPLLQFGNLLYYGDRDNIRIPSSERTLDRWFNTSGCVATAAAAGPGDTVVPVGQPCTQGFEKRTAQTLAAYQVRTFPTYLDGLRADSTSVWNINLQRNVKLRESVTLQFRADALNALNRSQFNGPDLNPTSTNFGRITSQSNATNRFLQFQMRLIY